MAVLRSNVMSRKSATFLLASKSINKRLCTNSKNAQIFNEACPASQRLGYKKSAYTAVQKGRATVVVFFNSE